MVIGIKQRQIFTYQQIKDYMTCPLCYHIEHVEKNKVSSDYYNEHQRIASDEAMLSAITFYYYKHFEGTPPSLKQLYNKYYSELVKLLGLKKERNFITDTVTTDSSRSVTRNGYKWMRQFYEWNAQTPQAIIAVNHPFRLNYDELTVEANFPVIREIQNEKGEREIELIFFGQTSKSSPEASKVNDADATVLLKGFQEAFGVNPDKLLLYSVERGKPYEVYRTEGDLNRLQSTFLGFYESVQNVQPYQRLGAHPYHGKFKHLCDTYYD